MYKGINFKNESKKIVELDIEGYIGYEPWDNEADIIHTKEKMKAELKKLAEIKAETIIVNINSYGGDVNHGISIHDLLAQNKAYIIIKINGMTASAATIIAMSGDEIKMSDNALFLIHYASTLTWGNKNILQADIDDLKTVDKTMANIYAKRANKPIEEIYSLMDENNGDGKWLTAEETKNYGFITEIFEPLKAAAAYNNDTLIKHNLPSIPENLINNLTNNNKKDITNTSLFQKIKNLFENKKTQTLNNKLMDPKILSILSIEDKNATIDDVINSINNLINDKKDIENKLSIANQEITKINNSLNNIDNEIIEKIENTDEKIIKIDSIIKELRKTAGANTAPIIKKSDKNDDLYTVSSEENDFMENVDKVAKAYL